jgi:predicted neutral ceramidase superfamily lipid hydrolase
MNMTTQSSAPSEPKSQSEAVPAVNVYTVDELNSFNDDQRNLYDWDFSKEREFMENLFCTRFNFLLVVYSLFVTAAAAAAQYRALFISVLFAGATVCFMVWLTIMRAYAKLDVIFKVLYRAFPNHPISIIDKEAAKSGTRLFRVNPIIAYWLPAFTVLSLIGGGVAALACWL